MVPWSSAYVTAAKGRETSAQIASMEAHNPSHANLTSLQPLDQGKGLLGQQREQEEYVTAAKTRGTSAPEPAFMCSTMAVVILLTAMTATLLLLPPLGPAMNALLHNLSNAPLARDSSGHHHDQYPMSVNVPQHGPLPSNEPQADGTRVTEPPPGTSRSRARRGSRITKRLQRRRRRGLKGRHPHHCPQNSPDSDKRKVMGAPGSLNKLALFQQILGPGSKHHEKIARAKQNKRRLDRLYGRMQRYYYYSMRLLTAPRPVCCKA